MRPIAPGILNVCTHSLRASPAVAGVVAKETRLHTRRNGGSVFGMPASRRLAVLLTLAGMPSCGAPTRGEEPGVAAAADSKVDEASASEMAGKTGESERADAGAVAPVDFPGDLVAHPPSAVEWFEGSHAAARAAARERGAPLLLVFGADWCGPCHELDRVLFSRPELGESLSRAFVPMHVDIDKREGPELARRYRVNGFPTLVVTTAGGLELGRVTDVMPTEEPVADARALKARLTAIAGEESALLEKTLHETPAPDELGARYRRAEQLALAGQRELAAREYERVLAGDPDGAHGFAPEARFDRAVLLFERLDRDPAGTLAELDALTERFPESRASKRGRLVRARALHALGRDEEALAVFAAPVDGAVPDRDAVAYAWFCLDHGVDREGALDRVERAIGRARARDSAELRLAQVALAEALGRPTKALEGLRALVKLEPRSAHHRDHARRLLAGAKGGSAG